MNDDDVVIVDDHGDEHLFPAGFDPIKAAAIVRELGGHSVAMTSRDVNQSRMALAAENATPIQEPTSFWGGFTKHLLTKEPVALGALATIPAAFGGPLGLIGAGASKAMVAGAPLVADLVQRASKFFYRQPQDPVTLGEVAGVASGPAMVYGLPASAAAAAKLREPAGAVLRVAGKVLDNPIAGAASPRLPHVGRIVGRVGQAMSAAPTPSVKPHFSGADVAAIRDLMARGMDEARAIRMVKP